MGDLTTLNDGPLVTAIYDLYKHRGDNEARRAYLGASAIGNECSRKLWYGFRWASHPAFNGRMYRLFQTGHLAEPRFIKDLRDIGVEVFERDPETALQFHYCDIYGHFQGNTDGLARRVPGGGAKDHLLEFKTHSARSFTELTKKGVELSHPTHYAQVQTYMGWGQTERCLYLAVNKDTEELYAERIAANPAMFAKIRIKAEAIIFATLPPARISDDPAFFVCKMCDHRPVCHGSRVPLMSCRTCVHITPTKTGNGAWHCDKFDFDPTYDQQRTGCASHLPLPPLVQYAEAEDAGDDWILFRHKATGRQFVVGNTAPATFATLVRYTSAEIAAAFGSAITDPQVDDLRQGLGATIK